MCGRFILGDSSWAEYHASLSIVTPDTVVAPAPSWNIKPTQDINIVTGRPEGLQAGVARWWFVPHWYRGDVKDWKATTFNARIESAADKATFRTAWRSGRCLVPASGYYEWTGPKGKKTPWFITGGQNLPVFFFAGLASTLADGTATCAILTRDAADPIAHLHPRMPVMLQSEEVGPWMAGEDPDEAVIENLGTGWDGRLHAHEVARFGMGDDGPDLIEPVGRRLL